MCYSQMQSPRCTQKAALFAIVTKKLERKSSDSLRLRLLYSQLRFRRQAQWSWSWRERQLGGSPRVKFGMICRRGSLLGRKVAKNGKCDGGGIEEAAKGQSTPYCKHRRLKKPNAAAITRPWSQARCNLHAPIHTTMKNTSTIHLQFSSLSIFPSPSHKLFMHLLW